MSGASHKAMSGESNWWINSRLKLLSVKTEKNAMPSISQEIGLTSTINLSKLSLIMVLDSCLISNIQLSHKSLKTQQKMVPKNSYPSKQVITSNLTPNVIKLWLDSSKTCQARLVIQVPWLSIHWPVSGANKKLTTIWKKQFRLRPIQMPSKLLLLRLKIRLWQVMRKSLTNHLTPPISKWMPILRLMLNLTHKLIRKFQQVRLLNRR